MNELKIFNNNEFGEVRTIEIKGEAWFIGKDVASALGYSNTRDALSKRVDLEDKGVANHDTLGGTQEVTIINESGLYSLILSSKLPNAKKFKKWVTSEVLPSIRKNGMYATDELLDNPQFAIEVFSKLKEEREQNKKLEQKNKLQTQQIAELKPKADYMDRILQSKGTVAVSVISKDYGMSATKFNKLLNKLKIQYKQGDIWLLYAKYQSAGYTHTKTFDYTDSKGMPQVRVSTEWTQKGRVFLYNLLKESNVLPLIEIENTVA